MAGVAAAIVVKALLVLAVASAAAGCSRRGSGGRGRFPPFRIVRVPKPPPNSFVAELSAFKVNKGDQKCRGTLELKRNGRTRTLNSRDADKCTIIDRRTGDTLYGKTRVTASVSGNCCWRIHTASRCSGGWHYNFVPGKTAWMPKGIRAAKVVDC